MESEWKVSGFVRRCNRGGKGRAFLRLIDTKTWEDAYRLDPSDKMSTCGLMPAFSSDSKQMAVLGRRLTVYSTDDGHVIKFSELENGWAKAHGINAIAYIPNTYTLLIGGSEFVNHATLPNLPKELMPKPGFVWYLESTETIPTRKWQAYQIDQGGLASDVISLAISPDGKQVATGASTGSGFSAKQLITDSVHIFRLTDGALLGAPLDGVDRGDGHSFGQQTGLAYTPDGHYLIVGHDENISKAIHLIDSNTLKVVDEMHAGAEVYDIAMHPKSTHFAAGTGKQVIVWSLPATR